MDDTLLNKINTRLKTGRNTTVNIINDKLTLAVFSMLRDNLKNVATINFIIRDPRTLPASHEVTREFDISPQEALFNTYDIMEKNKLHHFEQARTMYDFIKKHVTIKRTTEACRIKGNLLLIDDTFMLQGSSSLEFSPKPLKAAVNHINFDSVIYQNMDPAQISQARRTFQRIWNQADLTRDYKDEILNSLAAVYKDHSPEFLYYFTLNALFGHQLDHGVERFEKDQLQFKKTNIWNMLYDFQKDCVLSAIQKINAHNGCIIADSVGLGKTFEALAVIKYFELRQDNVLVLTPAKLDDNWNSFKGAYKDSILDETFYYKIMFHTDLSRYKGESRSGWDLARFDWSKFDLVVIDESHNFRNRTEKELGQTRYQRLLNEVIKQNRNTKVLLLSATPVNNSLNDLRNQISIITGDRDDAFEDAGLPGIANILHQTSYNNKIIFSHEDREFHTAKMHRFNLFKRLDSSVFAFGETIHRLKERIEACITLLETNTTPDLPDMASDLDEEVDFLETDSPVLDYKYIIKVHHLDAPAFLADLYFDKTVLDNIYTEVQTLLEQKRDNKLTVLKTVVRRKIKETPYNNGNRKVLIFTAFSDTARYLYDALVPSLSEENIISAMITGSDKPRVSSPDMDNSFDAVLAAFSPRSKTKSALPQAHQVDILIGTDCISEGQNLQDCDCVINYDIQWNPVTLIQRFGRIDRIGSINTHIKMINFFPDIALNDYLSLEKRVKSKMVSANISASGNEDILSPEMNDIGFRSRQLERLREEVIDMDEARDNISLTDLNMNEYLFELADYIKENPAIHTTPQGTYAVTSCRDHSGIIFCFRHRDDTAKPENDSSLYPYYLIFMGRDGSVVYGNKQARALLKQYRKLCYGNDKPMASLVNKFLEDTCHTKDMAACSELLTHAVRSIQGEEEKAAEETIFDFSGYNNLFAGNSLDDFELISFLVVG